MEPSSGGQNRSGETYFDHDQCYRDSIHVKSKAGRQWCREHGPASRSGRDYAGGVTSKTAAKNLSGSSESGNADIEAAEHRSRRARAAEC